MDSDIYSTAGNGMKPNFYRIHFNTYSGKSKYIITHILQKKRRPSAAEADKQKPAFQGRFLLWF